MILRFLILVAYGCAVLDGGGISLENWLSETKCGIRYQYKDYLKSMINCSYVKKVNSLCRRDIVVVYSHWPPYCVTDEEGKASGILQVLLGKILSDHCCLGCNNVTFLPPKGFREKYNFLEKIADIAMPVENGRHSQTFFSHSYVTLFELESVSFLGKKTEATTSDLLTAMIDSITSTWPLFVVAFTMSICAGTIIWLMDTWFNNSQFPRRFPRGPFEGFWWAYVSMTTVGYGDRTPQSVSARLFAVCWILIGITIFNMYTATITSVLTTEVGRIENFDAAWKNVGVIANNTAVFSGAYRAYAIPIVYPTISALKLALDNDEVSALAFEELTALYFKGQWSDDKNKYEVYSKVSLKQNAMGIVSNNPNITRLIRSFMDTNEDAIDIIYSAGRKRKNVTHKGGTNVTSSPFSEKSTTFLITLSAMVVISLVCFIVGVIADRLQKKSTKDKNIASPEGIPN